MSSAVSGEAITGIPTIRAYGRERQFAAAVTKAIDDADGAFFLTFATQCWLSVRLDAAGNLMVFTLGILVVTSRLSVDPGISGLVLSFILSIVQWLQYAVRLMADMENNMNSAERLHHYAENLEVEAYDTSSARQPPPSWPESGAITLSGVQMRYRPELPTVLHDLNLSIKPGERIGIVGRTGAGKSSIVSMLFRLVECSAGSIEIDGFDISRIDLHTLRSRMTIIPQDPALFQGTIRSNLDPFNEHTDLELWTALRGAHLVDADDRSARINLETSVEEEGQNSSLGQRQLMALARALVRRSQIVICDEATSSIDFATDRRIQNSLRQHLSGCTILCIAHRLRTILDYDRICVLDQGRIVECDAPMALWERASAFRGMCERSRIVRRDFEVHA